MATLATLRASLNTELAVQSDGEDTVWDIDTRNAAISRGYAELWPAGVWKDTKQDLASVDDTWNYALTSIRRSYRIELLDSSSRVVERPIGFVEPDFAGVGTHQLTLVSPVAAGYTIRVRGWGPYKSVFTGDSDTDDLPAEYNRIPLLKAKAILCRRQLMTFARYGQRSTTPPAMNVSAADLFSIIASAEREFEELSSAVARQRPRAGQLRGF